MTGIEIYSKAMYVNKKGHIYIQIWGVVYAQEIATRDHFTVILDEANRIRKIYLGDIRLISILFNNIPTLLSFPIDSGP